jgi:hypothetical protein
LNLSAATVSVNFVYRHPSIKALAGFTFELAHGGAAQDDKKLGHANAMQQLVERFSYKSSDYPRCLVPDMREPAIVGKDVIIVTGTTGALGSSVLAKLVELEDVAHVYAFNRRSNDGRTLEERQREAFLKRNLDSGMASSLKVSLCEVDFEDTNFGLSEALLEELRCTVTHVFHIGVYTCTCGDNILISVGSYSLAS